MERRDRRREGEKGKNQEKSVEEEGRKDGAKMEREKHARQSKSREK